MVMVREDGLSSGETEPAYCHGIAPDAFLRHTGESTNDEASSTTTT